MGIQAGFAHLHQQILWRHNPESHRFQHHLRQIHAMHRNGIQLIEVDALIGKGVEIGCHLAPVGFACPKFLFAQLVVDVMDVSPAKRLRVIADFDFLNTCDIPVEIQFFHHIGIALMHVNSAWMQDRLRIVSVDFTQRVARLNVFNDYVCVGVVAQGHFVLRGF